MLRFEYLAEVILGKYDRVFLTGALERCVAHVNQVRSQWQLRTMLFDDPEWQHAGVLRFLNGLLKIRTSQLFPMGGESLAGRAEYRAQQDKCQPHIALKCRR